MKSNKRLIPYLFVAPAVALLAFVFGYPVIKIVEFSFKMVRGIDGPWIGWRNYELVLSHQLFWDSVTHNAQLLFAIPVMVALAILLAALLYERVKGWRIYRVVLFLPYIIAVPIIAVVIKRMLQFNGPVNEALNSFGLGFMALDWLGSSSTALFTVAMVIIGREAALGTVLFLARLMSLEESQVESAKLDGASWWQRLVYVLLPQMRSVIEFFVVISIITMLASVFAYVYMISGGRGGPGTSTMVLELYIFNGLVRSSLPGIASAVSVMLLLVSIAIMLPWFLLRKPDVE